MSQFPLIIAIEPRLLPYACANGFTMDRKVGSGRSIPIYVILMFPSALVPSIEISYSGRCSNVLHVQEKLG